MPAREDLVWTDVAIFNGDVLSEATLDAMQGNADYVREDHTVLLVGAAPGILEGIEVSIPSVNQLLGWLRLKLTMSAMTLYSTQFVSFVGDPDLSVWRHLSIVNQPWTSPAAGSAADLVLSLQLNEFGTPMGSWSDVAELCRVPGALRRNDFNFISAWVDINPLVLSRRFRPGGQADWSWIRCRDLTVLGSREDEGFAP